MNAKSLKLAAAVAKCLGYKINMLCTVNPERPGIVQVLDMGPLGCYSSNVLGLLDPVALMLPPADLAAIAKERETVWAADEKSVSCSASSGMTWKFERTDPVKRPAVERQGPAILVDAKYFARELSAAQTCTSSEAHRRPLSVVFLDTDRGKLRLVSTDGRRLRIRDTKTVVPSEWPGVMLPYKDHKAVWSAISAIGGEILIRSFSETGGAPMLSISGRGFSLDLPMMEGTYPNYRQLVPTAAAVSFPARGMIDAAARFAATKQEDRAIRFDGLSAYAAPVAGRPDFSSPLDIPALRPLREKLIGEAADEARRRKKQYYDVRPLEELEALARKDAEVLCFNPEFLADAVGCDTCGVTDFFAPAAFSGPGLTYVLMPMRGCQ